MDKKLLQQSVKKLKLSDKAKLDMIKKCRESLYIPQKLNYHRKLAFVGMCSFTAGLAVAGIVFLLVGRNDLINESPVIEVLEDSMENGITVNYGSSTAITAGRESEKDTNPLPEISESETKIIGQSSGDYTPDESSIGDVTEKLPVYILRSNRKSNIEQYHPEGYQANIGSALAVKMSVTDDPAYLFRVILYSQNNMETVIEKANRDLKEKINFAKFQQNVTLNDILPSYYTELSAEQIRQLAGLDVQCFYVGTGEGSAEEISGDGYILVNDPSVNYYIDIYE